MISAQDPRYTSPYTIPACVVCRAPLELRLTQGRQSHKPFVMLRCPQDGRHFRAFINDRAFVAQMVARLEGQPPPVPAPG